MGKGIYTPRSIAVRCAVVLIGVLVTSLGSSFYIFANLGTDPVTSFVQGVSSTMAISFGSAMNIFNLVCFVLVLIFNRKLINIGTVIYTLLLGWAFDAIGVVFSKVLPANLSIVTRVLMLCVGTVLLGFGLGLYQGARLGAGPSDAMNQMIAAKLNIPLAWERVGFDIIMVVGGFLLGGVISVGTLVGMLAVGPIMGPTMNLFIPKIDRWSKLKEAV